MVIDKEKPATVRPVGGLRNSVGSAGLNKSQHSEAKNPEQEFVLASLRSVSLLVRQIVSEIDAAGAALKGGLISPQMALEWVDEVAPGCIGFIPEALQAFRVKRREGEAA